MSHRYSLPRSPLVAMLGLTALLTVPVGAQYSRMDRPGLQLPFENGRIRVTQISVPAGGVLPAAGNRVLIYLTADADGRMPADAVWQSADTGNVQNRGSATLEAIAIEFKDAFKDAATAQAGGTPPEALDARYGVDVSTIIDNPRVLVTKQRYGPIAYGGPLHLHPADVVVVYLGGGYTWPAADLWGASRVQRGGVEVIPANSLHRLSNAGSDRLELLTIVPK